MVITDSQAFEKVSEDTPSDVLLTSFRYLWQDIRAHLKQQ